MMRQVARCISNQTRWNGKDPYRLYDTPSQDMGLRAERIPYARLYAVVGNCISG